MSRKDKQYSSEKEIAITSSKETVLSKKKPISSSKKKKRTVAGAKKRAKKRESFIEKNEYVIEELQSSISEGSEQEHLKEYLYLYKSLKRLARKAKRQALKSGQSRDYYSYCTLISQQREVIADIRMISDLSGQVQMLIEQALQPMVSELGQVVVNSYYQSRKLLMETVKEKETQFALKKLDEIIGEVSKALQHHYEQATVKIQDILVGEAEKPTKKKRKF